MIALVAQVTPLTNALPPDIATEIGLYILSSEAFSVTTSLLACRRSYTRP